MKMTMLKDLDWYVQNDILKELQGRTYVAIVDTADYVPDVSEYEGVYSQGCDPYECESTPEDDPDHFDEFGRHKRRLMSKYWPLRRKG